MVYILFYTAALVVYDVNIVAIRHGVLMKFLALGNRLRYRHSREHQADLLTSVDTTVDAPETYYKLTNNLMKIIYIYDINTYIPSVV